MGSTSVVVWYEVSCCAVSRVGGDEEIFLVYPGSAVGGALSMLH